MAEQASREQRPIAALFVALATAAMALQLPHAQCRLEAGLDAFAPSITLSACGVGVTMTL